MQEQSHLTLFVYINSVSLHLTKTLLPKITYGYSYREKRFKCMFYEIYIILTCVPGAHVSVQNSRICVLLGDFSFKNIAQYLNANNIIAVVFVTH